MSDWIEDRVKEGKTQEEIRFLLKRLAKETSEWEQEKNYPFLPQGTAKTDTLADSEAIINATRGLPPSGGR